MIRKLLVLVVFGVAVVHPAMSTDRIVVSGLPDAAELAGHAAEGITLVVDLRTPGEGLAQEAVQVAELGMRYVNLPVGSEAASAMIMARVASLVAETQGRVLLHCASGNRAAEVRVRMLRGAGMSREQALIEGRIMGLQPAREVFVQ